MYHIKCLIVLFIISNISGAGRLTELIMPHTVQPQQKSSTDPMIWRIEHSD